MTDDASPQGSHPVLTAAFAQLFVADIRAACAFYERVLGFATVFVHGDPPFYGQVARNGVRLNLRHVDTPVFDDGRRQRESLLSVYVEVDDVDAIYAQFQRAGAQFQQPLTIQPWNRREFVVRDADGNLLCFAE